MLFIKSLLINTRDTYFASKQNHTYDIIFYAAALVETAADARLA